MVADGGGVGKDPRDGGLEGDGLFGGLAIRRSTDAEGEMGGEHLMLHAGQFLFDDNHWRIGEYKYEGVIRALM